MTSAQLFESEKEEVLGQEAAWKYTFAFTESMVVKCAVYLGIPDIIAKKAPNAALTLSEIASELPSDSPDSDLLFRVMRFLVAVGFFTGGIHPGEEGYRYGLTAASKWMTKSTRRLSMAPYFIMENEDVQMAPWNHLHECVLRGGFPFDRAHGSSIWDYASQHPEFNTLFSDAMANNTAITMRSLLNTYKGFSTVSSLVDVGGAKGTAVSEIADAYPNISTVINFDLPHVVASAPTYPRVRHYAGNMFDTIPSADCLFVKWILHDWADEDCVRILKKCRDAIGEGGKVVLVEAVLTGSGEEGKGMGMEGIIGITMDLVMVTHTSGGRERTEQEWRKLLAEGGFSRCTFVSLPLAQYVIEAFP